MKLEWPMFWRRKPVRKRSPTQAKNAPGKFYVDGWSMVCGLCPTIAPNNCRMSDQALTCEVFKQPETPEEEAQLREAMDMSCVQCIHDDGDDKWGQPPYEPPKPDVDESK